MLFGSHCLKQNWTSCLNLAFKLLNHPHLAHLFYWQVELPLRNKKMVFQKLLSKQRKRAVVACFRMAPLYNLPRYVLRSHFIVLHLQYLALTFTFFKDIWLGYQHLHTLPVLTHIYLKFSYLVFLLPNAAQCILYSVPCSVNMFIFNSKCAYWFLFGISTWFFRAPFFFLLKPFPFCCLHNTLQIQK